MPKAQRARSRAASRSGRRGQMGRAVEAKAPDWKPGTWPRAELRSGKPPRAGSLPTFSVGILRVITEQDGHLRRAPDPAQLRREPSPYASHRATVAPEHTRRHLATVRVCARLARASGRLAEMRPGHRAFGLRLADASRARERVSLTPASLARIDRSFQTLEHSPQPQEAPPLRRRSAAWTEPAWSRKIGRKTH
jgi:hypothetical protein